MKEANNPWMKFYPSDWRSDPMLRLCSLAARGLWIEMMCLMHEADPYGSMLVNGRRLTKVQMAALVGISEKECSALMLELEGAGVFSRDADGTTYSRRMRRDAEKAGGGREQVKKRWGDAEPATRAQRLSAARQKGRHSPEEWQAMLLVFDHKCVRCGDDEGGKGVVKDHITPIYKGGSDHISNLQPLCSKCNHSKGPDTTDHRFGDWEKRLGERLGATSTGGDYKTTTQKPEARSQRPEAKGQTSEVSSQKSEKEGTREVALASGWPADWFEQFWKLYPNKRDPKGSKAKLAKVASEGVVFDAVMAGLERYVAKTDDRPWCNPTTWINQSRWNEETIPHGKAKTGGSIVEALLNIGQHFDHQADLERAEGDDSEAGSNDVLGLPAE